MFWKKAAKQMLLVPGIVTMVFTCMPQAAFEAYAADPIAKMGGGYYWNFGSLVDDIDDQGGKTGPLI